MLFGQQLGGGQQGPLVPRADGCPEGGGGHQGLAAAHVPLQQAVHGGLAGHIGQDLVHRPALGPGGGKGQAGPEGPRIGPAHGRPGGGAAPVFQAAHPQLQHQQLLKDQPPPGLLHRLGGGGHMDVPHGLGLAGQAVFLQQGRGQGLAQQLGVGQQLGHAPADGRAGQPLGLGVDGGQGGGLDLPGGAHLGVCHLAAEQPAGDLPLKIIFLPQFQFLDGVGVVEPGQLQGGDAIPGGGFFHPAAPGDIPPALLGQQLGPHHAFHSGGRLARRVGVGKVQIPAGIMFQQVRQGADAQLFKPLGQLGSHPLEVLHRSVGGQGGSVFALRQGRGLLSQSRHGQNIFIVALNRTARKKRRGKDKKRCPTGAL